MGVRSKSSFQSGDKVVILRVQVTQAERDQLERAARADDRSLAGYIRHVAMLSVRRIGPTEVKHGDPSTASDC
jgi:hypothetical protein